MFNRMLFALALSSAATAPLTAQAQLMQATVTGTVSGGSDFYSNSVLLGPNDGTNLFGLPASLTIIYDAALAGPNYPGYAPNWSFRHEPNWPAFLGIQGMGPVRSASFTVNGITLALDVSGAYEVHTLTVANPASQYDSYMLGGGDKRSLWCPNDRQCQETWSVSAYQSYGDDLFGGQRDFDPANPFAALAAPGRSIDAYVRLIQNPVCLVGGARAGDCPEGRFTDGATHWVELGITGTQLSVTAVVPEPGTWALMLAGLAAVGGLARRRRA